MMIEFLNGWDEHCER